MSKSKLESSIAIERNSAPLSPRILLLVSGSIAGFKAVALCSKLVQNKFEVEVVMTPSAKQFIGAASFEGLTRRKVHIGNFDEGSMMNHIDLERWADLILLYPATANSISALANGNGSTLIGALFLAHQFNKPWWIAPAMNSAMLLHPATCEHLEKLQKWGIRTLHGDEGVLACGDTGKGRAIEPETLLNLIQSHFKENQAKSPTVRSRILITAGGTTEPIDQVRSITNISTGETGYTLARALLTQGHDVTLFQSRLSRFRDFPRVILYQTTEEFTQALKTELETHDYDHLIHAAAVADYHVEAVHDEKGRSVKTETKIQSSHPILIKLSPNPKIIRAVRGWSKNKSLKVISFKLTTGESDLGLDRYDSEWIVHNELKNVGSVTHRGTLYQKVLKKKTANKGSLPYIHEKHSNFETKAELTDMIKDILYNSKREEKSV